MLGQARVTMTQRRAAAPRPPNMTNLAGCRVTTQGRYDDQAILLVHKLAELSTCLPEGGRPSGVVRGRRVFVECGLVGVELEESCLGSHNIASTEVLS